MNDIRPESKVNILGTEVTPISKARLHQAIVGYIQAQNRALILNVNVHCLNLCYEQPRLQEFMNSAAINFCDGYGVKLGAWLLGVEIGERITYADWMWDLAELASNGNFALYFLGGKPGIAEIAGRKLQETFPELKISGTHHGYFDKDVPDVNDEIINQINAAQPDILIVGFGMPLQEYWLQDNWQRLNAIVGLTGGAAFDYVAGEVARAPSWMTNNGLEWLGRLILEPSRLFRRYVVGNPKFLLRILRQRIMK
ncbi:MAG: WecB/TagA/CpsF family glycosyltransferase [Anaerolineales bacterium]|nr:WecB/TagA/CpsF family glycosyltransferase [Anaerolineales bacterium]